MGIYDDSTGTVVPVPGPDLIAAVANANYATNQFKGIGDIEPNGSLDRLPADNPPFAWPKNKTHYVDGTNNTTLQTIQRGYMRSLITDPNVDITAKNRRLFFQFNPQAIRREVSQTPGAMLPLLQSPEQLMQPVPGVSTFGFSLLFNREAEVNQGRSPVVDDATVRLPNGDPALVSQIGVLADLLVLDIITGQGISKDLIDSISKRQVAITNRQIEQEKKDFEALPDAAKEEASKTYVPSEPVNTSELTDKFNLNIGNAAFLNPLPFRVLFSTLFMVEGIATSVEVNFTKFSQTMVPTQCTVTISMYALYIGFARKNTFLLDNLTQGAKDAAKQKEKDDKVIAKLNKALKQINFERTKFYENQYGKDNGFEIKANADRTNFFKKQLEQKELKNVRVRITIQTAFKKTDDQLPRSTQWIDKHWEPYEVTVDDGVIDIPIDKITGTKVLRSEGLNARLANEKNSPDSEKNKYVSFRYKVEIVSEGDAGDVTAEKILYTDPVLSLKIIDYSGAYQEKNNLIAKNSQANID